MIIQFFHCRKCAEEKPSGVSMQQFARLEAGFTSDGDVQVSCVRHGMEIVTLERAVARPN